MIFINNSSKQLLLSLSFIYWIAFFVNDFNGIFLSSIGIFNNLLISFWFCSEIDVLDKFIIDNPLCSINYFKNGIDLSVINLLLKRSNDFNAILPINPSDNISIPLSVIKLFYSIFIICNSFNKWTRDSVQESFILFSPIFISSNSLQHSDKVSNNNIAPSLVIWLVHKLLLLLLKLLIVI